MAHVGDAFAGGFKNIEPGDAVFIEIGGGEADAGLAVGEDGIRNDEDNPKFEVGGDRTIEAEGYFDDAGAICQSMGMTGITGCGGGDNGEDLDGACGNEIEGIGKP